MKQHARRPCTRSGLPIRASSVERSLPVAAGVQVAPIGGNQISAANPLLRSILQSPLLLRHDSLDLPLGEYVLPVLSQIYDSVQRKLPGRPSSPQYSIQYGGFGEEHYHER